MSEVKSELLFHTLSAEKCEAIIFPTQLMPHSAAEWESSCNKWTKVNIKKAFQIH